MIRALVLVAAAASLGACSTFPDVGGQISPETQRAGFPALLPAESLRAQVATGPIEPRDQPIIAQAEQIDNRANALRARASGLQGDVIDATDRNQPLAVRLFTRRTDGLWAGDRVNNLY